VPVSRILEDGERRLDLRERHRLDTLYPGAVERDTGGTETVTDQKPGERAAEGMAHDDRRLVQSFDDLRHVVHDFADADVGRP
jgi:hypothetical protein